MSIEDKAAEIARGLTRDRKEALLNLSALPDGWHLVSQFRSPRTHTHTARMLTCAGLAERRHVKFAVNSYRLTPLGLAVASHLKDPRS